MTSPSGAPLNRKFLEGGAEGALVIVTSKLSIAHFPRPLPIYLVNFQLEPSYVPVWLNKCLQNGAFAMNNKTYTRLMDSTILVPGEIRLAFILLQRAEKAKESLVDN